MTDQEINEAVARKLYPDGYPGSHGNFVKNYCTNIAAAWEVMQVKHIALVPLKTGWLASSCEVPGEEGECLELWYPTSCMTRGKCGCLRCEIADTAPMAICLAFLKVRIR